MFHRSGLILALVLVCGGAAHAQSPGPQPLAMPAAIPAPQDVAYPGVIRLEVDATDLERRIFNVRETISVAGPGPLTLLYPQWLPGNHGPYGQADKLAGLVIKAGGQRLAWTRDPVSVFAFHVDVPAGASALDLEFQFLSAVESSQGRVMMTPEMLNVQWNTVVLYPAGYFARQIPVAASVRLPDGWQFATSLDTASTNGAVSTFKATSLDTLVDSPMFAGRHFMKVDLTPGTSGPGNVSLNIVADRAALLEAKPEHIAAHRALVTQAAKLYGSRHYDRYNFLLALTDQLGGIGLEHHQSSENGTVPDYFTEWDKHAGVRDLLPHEYTHSWNGKFRRGADLWTPNFNVLMQDSLLWVYEGQTQYWGVVLAARSGLIKKQEALDSIAATAATFDVRVGRAWKALQDTTNDPLTIARRATAWRSWQRGEDYYQEGQLMWLEADTLIREKSGGKKSLDDFAKGFFGINNTSFVPVTYAFDDVVKALNNVQPHDWAAFLRERLDATNGKAPLDGLARGGYKLVYTDTPTDFFKAVETQQKSVNLTYSLGLTIGREARLTAVQWDGLAFQKGLTVGTQIVAVNGMAYEADRIKDAIKDAQKNATPIDLIVKKDDRFWSVRFDYRGGLRYPRLERVAKTPARLDQILAAR
ncbi:MAG: M61 family peptidase [Rhodospirillaceae bacterium]|nr:M61 family peptidase [Rhodospirillaceae bacterium]